MKLVQIGNFVWKEARQSKQRLTVKVFSNVNFSLEKTQIACSNPCQTTQKEKKKSKMFNKTMFRHTPFLSLSLSHPPKNTNTHTHTHSPTQTHPHKHTHSHPWTFRNLCMKQFHYGFLIWGAFNSNFYFLYFFTNKRKHNIWQNHHLLKQ